MAGVRGVAWVLLIALGAPACAGDRPPSIAPVAPLTVTVGETLVIDLAASDPDGDEVVFTVEGAPDGATLEPGDPWRFRYAPAANDAASGGRRYDLVFRADDGRGGHADAATTLTVFPEGATPAFQGPFAWTLDLAVADRVVAVLRVRDDDTAAVDFRLVKGIDGATFEVVDGHTAALVWRPTPDQAAAGPLFPFTVAAGDGVHREAVRDFAVLVVNPDLFGGCPGTAPTAWVDRPGDRREPGPTRLEVRAADAETRIASVACWWSATGETEEAAMNHLDLAPQGDRWAASIPDLSGAAGEGLAVAYHCRARDDDDPATGRCSRSVRVPKDGRFGFTVYGSAGAPCRPDALHRDGSVPDLPWGRTEGLRACGEARFRFDAQAGRTLAVRALARSGADAAPALEVRHGGRTTGGVGTVRVDLDGGGEGEVVVTGTDLTYALEAVLLDEPCPDPAGEAAPAPLFPGTTSGRLCPGDLHAWTVSVGQGEAARLALSFDPLAADLDLEVRRAGQAVPWRVSAGTAGEERIVADGPVSLEVRVAGADLRGAGYRLALAVDGQDAICDDDLLAPNGSPGAAPVLPEGAWDLKLCPGTRDHVRLDLNGGETLRARATAQGEAPALAILAGDGTTELASVPAGGGETAVEAVVPGPGPVFVRAGPGAGVRTAYTLEFGAEDDGCPVDRLEPNDAATSPAALGPGWTTHLTLCGADLDRFGFRLAPFEVLRVLSLDGTARARLSLAPPGGEVAATGQATEWGEELSFVAPDAGTWILTVAPAAGDGWYDLAVER